MVMDASRLFYALVVVLVFGGRIVEKSLGIELERRSARFFSELQMARRRKLIVGKISAFGLLSLLMQFSLSAQSARQLAQNAFPSVVLLVMQDANGQPVSLGSGFFVADGVIVTNLHVVRGASSGQVKLVTQTRTYPITGVVGVNANADIVLLEVRGTNAPALELNQGTDLAVGDVVYAVGNPEGLEGTFSP